MLTDESKIWFGKYNGKKLKEIPDSYFIWMWKQGMEAGTLKDYIEDSVPEIRKIVEAKKNQKLRPLKPILDDINRMDEELRRRQQKKIKL